MASDTLGAVLDDAAQVFRFVKDDRPQERAHAYIVRHEVRRGFNVLDDMPTDPDRWFGFCEREMEETVPCRGCGMWRAMDWVCDHGRHGRDDCERPDEWFEEI